MRIIIVLVLSLSLSLGVYYLIAPQNKLNLFYKIPNNVQTSISNQKEISDGMYKVSHGEEFSLRVGESAVFEDGDFSLKLVSLKKPFSFGCIGSSNCDWAYYDSNKYRHIEFTYNGNTYSDRNTSFTPYEIHDIDTDHSTYATFKIMDTAKRCEELTQKGDTGAPSCWLRAAIKFKKPEYCENIVIKSISPPNIIDCYNDYAEKLDDISVCKILDNPNKYCGYRLAVDHNNLEECTLLAGEYAKRCAVTIIKNNGWDITKCSIFKNSKYNPVYSYLDCFQALSGEPYGKPRSVSDCEKDFSKDSAVLSACIDYVEFANR